MAHFEDLTKYEYLDTPPTSGVLNVGWLGEGQPFNVGTTSEAFRIALKNLCDNNSMNFCFGYHLCEFCRPASRDDPYSSTKREKGNGEIRVQGAGGTWYVAPVLVTHYVVEHNYCPPQEFVEAVLNPAEIGKDSEPVPESEDEEIERVLECNKLQRAERGPPITETEIDRIVKRGIREARSLKPWWRFW